MEALLALAVLAAFGYFIYTRIKKSRARRNGSGGGGRPNDTNGSDTQLK